MCYYNSINIPKEKSLELKGKRKKLPGFNSLIQNGFDFGNFLIIKSTPDDWEMAMAHWELIAPWINSKAVLEESRKKYTTLNATAEKLLESKLFHEPTLKGRCIIPSSGFYEWRTYKGKKYPYYIYPDDSQEDQLFFMAGICNTWTDKTTGETMDTFAIITTKANPLMEQIHNSKKRMPLLFDKPHANEWLSKMSIDQIKAATTCQFDPSNMKAYTIAKDFISSRHPFEAYTYAELPAIEV